MLIFGYWIMGNRQIFLNKLEPMTRFHVNPDPHHHLFDISVAGITQDKMIFFFLFIYIAIKVFMNFIKPMFSKTSIIDMDLDIDEGLDPYWNCLSGSQQKILYATEVYYKNKFGIKNFDDEQMEKLRTGQKMKKEIDGEPNYDILQNTLYQDKF